MSQECCGYLDPVDGLLIRGWALSEDLGTIASVDILIDGAVVAQLPADSYRGDLDEEGIQQGFAAFFYEVPPAFHDGVSHQLDVRHSGTNRSLENAPTQFRISQKGRAMLAEKRRWAARHLVYEGATGARLAASLGRTRKLAIVSTYHEAPKHLRYHHNMMRSLANAGFTVLVVHASETHRPGLVETDDPNRFTILKRNIGYDFGSYAVGVFAACDHLGELDEMVMMNDSIVQIVDDYAPLIARFRAVGADVVACTDSFEHHYHLQSYMVWFGARVLRSGCLQNFMANYSFTSKKEDVIAEGEIGLSRMLLREGFDVRALFPYQDVVSAWIRRHAATMQAVRDLPGLPADWSGACFKKALLERLDHIMDRLLHGTPLNASHFFWDILIEDFGCPFVKRELIFVNPCNVPTYFKLASFFPTGTEAFETMTEIRHRYGGHLVAPSISPLDRATSDLAKAANQMRDGGEPFFKLVQRADENERAQHVAHRSAT